MTTSQNRLVKYTIVLNIIVNMSSSEGKPGEDSTTSKEDPTSGGILLSQEGNGENLRMNCYSYLNSSKDDGLNRQDVDLYRRKLRSKMTKTKYVNVLAHKYYAKKHLLFIFLPIQILSVWTTISGAACAYILIMAEDPSRSTEAPSDNSTNDTADKPMILRSLIDALVGASLLILTNLSNVLQYDALSKQHMLVSAQMDNLIDFVDFVTEKGGTDEYYDCIKEIENNFKVTISNDKLSPPSEIKLAFDILQSKLEVKLNEKSRRNVNTTYDPMMEYSLLASFIESRINLCTMLPNSRRSAKMIDDILDDSKMNNTA